MVYAEDNDKSASLTTLAERRRFLVFFFTALNFSFASFLLFQDKRNRRGTLGKISPRPHILIQQHVLLRVTIFIQVLFRL